MRLKRKVCRSLPGTADWISVPLNENREYVRESRFGEGMVTSGTDTLSGMPAKDVSR